MAKITVLAGAMNLSCDISQSPSSPGIWFLFHQRLEFTLSHLQHACISKEKFNWSPMLGFFPSTKEMKWVLLPCRWGKTGGACVSVFGSCRSCSFWDRVINGSSRGRGGRWYSRNGWQRRDLLRPVIHGRIRGQTATGEIFRFGFRLLWFIKAIQKISLNCPLASW